MKQFTLFLLLGVSFCGLQAQKVEIIDKNGKIFTDRISAFTPLFLFGKNSSYPMDSLMSIKFLETPSASLVSEIRRHEINIVPYQIDDPLLPPTANTSEWNYTDEIAQDINASGFLRTVGILGLSTGLFLSVAKFPDDVTINEINTRRKIIQGCSIGGGLCLTIGISLDTNAKIKMIRMKLL